MTSEQRKGLKFQTGEFYHRGTEAPRHGGVIDLELQDEALEPILQDGHIKILMTSKPPRCLQRSEWLNSEH